jgi:hypothetical protein
MLSSLNPQFLSRRRRQGTIRIKETEGQWMPGERKENYEEEPTEACSAKLISTCILNHVNQ